MPPILSVEDVSVSFDGFTVLDSLNFSMEPGELRFLIGPNGAGKTTLLDIMTGKTRPTRGRVVYDSKAEVMTGDDRPIRDRVVYDNRVDVLHQPEHELVRMGIARKFQTPSIFQGMSVYQNLDLAVGFRSPPWKLFAALPAASEERIAATLDQIGLAGRAADKAGTLSHGEKQWLEIGMLLVQEPKLLLLDEPVAGMTRRERTRTGELLQSIASHRTVLVVEHDMEFVRQFARTVTVLHLGRVLSEGPMEQVQQDPKVIEVYLGHNKARVA